MKLADKTILLTGASGGIGSALAQMLAAEGARLILQGRQLARLERLRAQLPEPERHRCLSADLATSGGRDQLLHDPALPGSIDILINNAGSNVFAWLEDQSASQIDEQIAVNITAPIQLTRALLPKLASPGLIMNIGSSFGGIGYPGYSVYCAAKFALRGFSEALGRELEGSGIQVLYFAPRATRTEINSKAVYAMNAELGARTDSAEFVAACALEALTRETRRRWLGWPEGFFVRLNGLFPGFVDRALAKQLPIIARYARTTQQEI